MRIWSFLSVILLSSVLAACTVNPVTGERELNLVPLSQQIAMGEANYLPYQQQQGGRYVVDADVNLYLNTVGRKLAAVSDQPNLPYEFVLLNNDTLNAWALPGGKIAINRGLLTLLEDEAQLAAVLAHEIVHAAAGHSAQQMTRAQLLGLGGAALASAAKDSQYGGILNQGAALGAGAWNAKYGRDDELESDEVGIRYMIKAGYDPKAAVELQEKFVALSKGQKHDFMSALFASHPPSEQRVARNRELSQNVSGQRHKQAFQHEIAQLRKDAPAYQKHQQALQALSQKDITTALSQVNNAIKRQPAEALFYITKGQALQNQKNTTSALTVFEKAAELNPEYFLGHLYAGLTAKELRQESKAMRGLEKSMAILPLPITAYHLGEIVLAQGKRTEATEYFSLAAQDKGDIGKAARAQLHTLNPATQTAP